MNPGITTFHNKNLVILHCLKKKYTTEYSQLKQNWMKPTKRITAINLCSKATAICYHRWINWFSIGQRIIDQDVKYHSLTSFSVKYQQRNIFLRIPVTNLYGKMQCYADIYIGTNTSDLEYRRAVWIKCSINKRKFLVN